MPEMMTNSLGPVLFDHDFEAGVAGGFRSYSSRAGVFKGLTSELLDLEQV